MDVILNRSVRPIALILFTIGILVTLGCNRTALDRSRPSVTDLRPLEERPAKPYLGTPSVSDLLSVCDIMARDLGMSAAVQTAKMPLVLEIKPIENKTGEEIDLTIFPQTIRGFINKQGVRNIVFRDEQARNQIVSERVGQSSENLMIQDSSTTHGKSTSRRKETKYGVGTLPPETIEDKEFQKTTKRTVEVSSKMADADYFLNGFIFAASEMSIGQRERGYRYFHFQFRLTSARTGLVVWENMYQVKREGMIHAQP